MSATPDTLAALLLRARQNGTIVQALPPELRPASLAEAYATADAILRDLGPIGGWKVGASSARGMAMLGLQEPFFAAVPRSAIGETAVWLSHRAVTVDAEIVFEMAGAPASDAPADVRAAVAGVRLGLEINAPRYAHPFEEGGPAIIADGGANEALVPGPELPLAAWDQLAAVPARLVVDGHEVAQGSGAGVLGDPWAALQWLAGALRRHGKQLEPGCLVFSGNMAFAEVRPGQALEAQFGAFGALYLRVLAPPA